MKRSAITVLIFLFTTGRIFSQSDFRNGYVIKNNNDTIYGYIDYKGNMANAKKCIFKKEIKSEKVEFGPGDILAYRFIDSKYYVSKNVATELGEDLLFLEYLINGIVDMYYYRDGTWEHYLVDGGDGKLLKLENEEKEVFIGGTKYVRNSKDYVGILKYTFKESPSLGKKVDHIPLNHKSLIGIANDFHNEVCADEECIIYEKKLPKMKIVWGPLLELNVISLAAKNNFIDDMYYLQNSHFDSNIYPSIGFFIKVNMPYLNERLYLQYEGTYSKWSTKTNNSYLEKVYNMNYLNDISITCNSFNNAGMMRYEFPNKKFSPIILAGGFANYLFKTDYLRELDVIYSWGDTFYTKEFEKSPFTELDYGLMVGIGITGKIISKLGLHLDVRYKRGFGIIEGLNTNNYVLNLGFQIGE